MTFGVRRLAAALDGLSQKGTKLVAVGTAHGSDNQ